VRVSEGGESKQRGGGHGGGVLVLVERVGEGLVQPPLIMQLCRAMDRKQETCSTQL